MFILAVLEFSKAFCCQAHLMQRKIVKWRVFSLKRKTLRGQRHTIKVQQSTFIYTILYPISLILSHLTYQRLRIELFSNPLWRKGVATAYNEATQTLWKFRYGANTAIFENTTSSCLWKQQRESQYKMKIEIKSANVPNLACVH